MIVLNDTEAGIARLQYWYQNTVISLYISNNFENIQSNSFSLPGGSFETIIYGKGEIPVSIIEIQEKENETPIYLAEWEWENHYYQLSAKMKKNIFEKILKEMIF